MENLKCIQGRIKFPEVVIQIFITFLYFILPHEQIPVMASFPNGGFQKVLHFWGKILQKTHSSVILVPGMTHFQNILLSESSSELKISIQSSIILYHLCIKERLNEERKKQRDTVA